MQRSLQFSKTSWALHRQGERQQLRDWARPRKSEPPTTPSLPEDASKRRKTPSKANQTRCSQSVPVLLSAPQPSTHERTARQFHALWVLWRMLDHWRPQQLGPAIRWPFQGVEPSQMLVKGKSVAGT